MIPKKIFFTHETKKYINKAILQEWRKNNPDFKIFFFNSMQRIRFIKTHYNEYYKYYMRTAHEYGALRADIWRYLVIYHYGGVYIDHKVRILESLSSILDMKSDMCVTYKGNKRSFYTKMKNFMCGEEVIQYFFAARKNSKILKRVLSLMLVRLKEQTQVVHKPLKYFLYPGTGNSGVYGVFFTTGPLMFTHALKDHLAKVDVHNNEIEGAVQYPKLSIFSFGKNSGWSYLVKIFSENNYHFCRKNIL